MSTKIIDAELRLKDALTATVKQAEVSLKALGLSAEKTSKSIDDTNTAMKKTQKSADPSWIVRLDGYMEKHYQTNRKLARSLEQTGNKIESIGKKAALVGTPLMAAAAAGVKASATLANGMAKVSTLVDTSVTDMKQLENGVRGIATDTGADLSTLTEAEYQLLSAGVKASDVTQTLSVVARGAKAGFTDEAKAADVVTTVLNSYGMSADQAGSVMDKLIMTQNKGKTTLDELSQSLGQVAAMSAQSGVSFDDLSAAIATMTAQGVKTPEAMTGLKALISGIVKPSEQAKKAFQAMGIEFGESALKSKGLSGMLKEIAEKTGMSGDALSQLFSSVEAQNAFKAAAGDLDKFGENLDAVKNSAGTADEAFQKMDASPAQQMAKAMREVQDASMDLGAVLAPYITRTAQAIKAAVKWWKSLSDGQREALVKIAALTAASSVSFIAFGKAIRFVGGTLGTVNKGLLAVSKAGGIGKAIAKEIPMLSTAGKAIARFSGLPMQMLKSFANFNARFAAGIRQFPTSIVGAFQKIPSALSSFVGSIGGGLRKGLSFFTQFGSKIKMIPRIIMMAFRGLRFASIFTPMGAAIFILTALVGVMITHWKQIKTAVTVAMNHVKAAVMPTFEKMQGAFSKVGKAVSKLQHVWSAAMSAITGDTSDNSGIITGVLNGLVAFIGWIFETAIQIVATAITVIANTIAGIVNIIADVVGMIKAIANGDWTQAWEYFKDIFVTIVDTIEEYFGTIIGGIVDKIHEVGNAAKSLLGFGGGGGDDSGDADGKWTGTTYFPGGVTWLHEQGPELVELPTGTKVIPHSESLASMYDQGRKDARGGSSLSVNIPKIADQIVVREDADIDKIANALAFKIKSVAINQVSFAQ